MTQFQKIRHLLSFLKSENPQSDFEKVFHEDSITIQKGTGKELKVLTYEYLDEVFENSVQFLEFLDDINNII